ncbi:hypothetical protein ABG067_007440 [Albugo candida]
MKLLNRLACLNPAFLIPFLRRILIQLLKDLRYAPVPPKDFDLRGQSTCLFVQLIRTKQDLVDPYLLPILQIIIPNILHGSHQTSLASAVLVAVVQLAAVAQRQLESFTAFQFPIVVYTLQDEGVVNRHQIALETLAALVGSSDCGVRQHLAFSTILVKALALLQQWAASPWQVRQEAM